VYKLYNLTEEEIKIIEVFKAGLRGCCPLVLTTSKKVIEG